MHNQGFALPSISTLVQKRRSPTLVGQALFRLQLLLRGYDPEWVCATIVVPDVS